MKIQTFAKHFTLMALTVVGALLAVAVVIVAQPTLAQPSGPQDPPPQDAPPEVVTAGQGGERGQLSPVQQTAIRIGYVPTNQQAYEQAKAEAEEKAKQRSAEEPSPSTPESNAPATSRTWEGVFDTAVGPSDSTGAIGTTRYIELVNRKFAIYNRTSNTPISSGSLGSLVGSSGNVFDPQVIWDPSTNRFYYVTDNVFSSSDNRLSVGFSKTASPNSAADFCKYDLTFGSRFPDYPKLGDLGGTSGLLLIGTNDFSPTGFLGSSLYSITKPTTTGSISTCPSPSTFTSGAKQDLRNANGSTADTPVPANEIDSLNTGYVVAHPSFSGNFLTIFAVTKNTTTGGINVSAPKTRTVASYSTPANAPQPGTTLKLDTLDTRNTQGVLAFDPFRGKYGFWTQHTVFGGAGAQVRWYEINPVPSTPGLLQSGAVSSSSGRFFFNGAISPDRKVRTGATSKFGDSMVLGHNSSSTTLRPDIRMVSKIQNGVQSASVRVRNSNVDFMNDFTCSSGVCRWGDYAAATPDPATPNTATLGNVWLTSNFVRTTGSSSSSGWGSQNWAAKP
jgi:hypothetical protein